MTHRYPADVLVGAALVGIMVVGSFLVPAVVPHDPNRSAGLPLLGPSWDHPFGTDQLGRDVFVRAFTAARLDLVLGIVGVAVPLALGAIVGTAVATIASSFLDGVWIVVVDGINALPLIVLVIALVGMIGPGAEGLMIALALTSWARYARIARVRTITIRDSPFIQAAGLLGYSRARILIRHLVPNVLDEVLAYARSDFVTVIVLIGGLSFLGLGVRPPTPEWGAMMSEGRLFISTEPWLVVFPGLMLTVLAVGVGLLTEGNRHRRHGGK